MKTLILALYPYNARGLDSWHDHGAGMVVAAARSAGHKVDFLDLKTLRSDAELKSHITGYDLIAFGVKSSYYPMAMKVKKMAKEVGAKVMIGGYHATAASADLVNDPEIDYVFKGEAEITFPAFLRNPDRFPRVITGDRPDNLDSLPWIDHSIYREPIEDCTGWWYGGRRRMISVITARGCPYQCAFCQPLEDNHFGKKLRRRSVDSVILELLHNKMYNPDCVMIHDDTFFLQDGWLEEFCEKYSQVGLPFWAAARADEICRKPELFRRLVKCGWELVSVGFESGSQRILDKMHKGTTVEQNIEAARIIKDAGAKVYGNYMLGLPWEHKEDIQLTMQMVDQINAEMPSWAYFTPYPGCKLGEDCVDLGWSLLDRNSYDRSPSGEKVKFVDYDYLRQCLGGFRETVPPLAVDIIIPCYENTELTLDCLASIYEYTPAGSYRVILIDNGSKDTSLVKLMLAKMDHLFIKLPINLGFVGAVNKGLAQSTAPTVCLLNNDTRVYPRWMEKLLAALYSDEKIGIVGPLTGFHRVGCDSQHSLVLHNSLVPVQARKWDIKDINLYLEEHYPGALSDISFVAFFCAFIKREVIDKIGPLDINFDKGMWDDVDYNIQAQKLGYRTALSIDTCIYHRGRSTFDIMQRDHQLNVDKILRDNKEYLDSKHGILKTPQSLVKKTFMRMV